MADKVLKVRVTLKGRPVRAYTFNKDVITVGRDPGSDICLDNPGVSREHCKIDFTTSGIYRIQDVGSANGIFVNDQQVKVHFIINNDVVFISKFALWFMYEEDRRGERDAATRAARTQDEGTTVLRTSELQDMITSIREAEQHVPAPATSAISAPGMTATAPGSGHAMTPATVASATASTTLTRHTRNLIVLGLLLAFALGYVAGGGLHRLPWQNGLAALAGAPTETQP